MNYDNGLRHISDHSDIGLKGSQSDIISNMELTLYPTERQEGAWSPREMGVNSGRADGGGPSPPSVEQDKQLITSRGGDNSLMEQQGGREEESGVTKRTHRALST